MLKDTVITIGRQFGSGGREIGRTLAKELDIPFYDRDLIAMASEKSGVHGALLEEVDEKASNAFLQYFGATSFVAGSRISLPTELSINDKLFFAQADIIKSVASKGACVIVGRCADYILRDRQQCVNAFVHADLEKRVERVSRLYGMDENEARSTIIKTDKRRASYYSYYTNKDWSDDTSYDLALKSLKLGGGGTVSLIKSFAEMIEDA
jgi:cytidylate kinase